MAQRNDDDGGGPLRWCASILGPFEVVGDSSKPHPSGRSTISRLRTPTGRYYLKTHQSRSNWESEVHAYERWAPTFGDRAPRLIAVHDGDPLSLIVSELPGVSLEDARSSDAEEWGIWRAAGESLATLHASAVGEFFGTCRRDGTPLEKPIYDAPERVASYLEEYVERGVRAECLTDAELAVVKAAEELLPAFEGERPVPCHGDYCPANWLVGPDASWAGVIDFEMARWDVWVADLTRHPDWEWIERPSLLDALFDGYGRSFTPRDEHQLLVARVQYALAAIVWGSENDYRGFVREGREALRQLGKEFP